MNEQEEQVPELTDYKNMYIYKLSRSEEKDKKGRPAVLIEYIGEESTIWWGTTVKKNKKEKPVTMKIGKRNTHFYINGLEKIKTKYLITNWTKTTNEKQEICMPLEIQKKLVDKFSESTHVGKPFETIKKIEAEKNNLINALNKQKEKKQSIKNLEKNMAKKTIMIENLKNEKLETKTTMKKQKININYLTNTVNQVKENNKELKQKNQNLKIENKQFETEKNKNLKTEKKNENLKKETERLKNKQKNLKNENLKSKTTIKNLKEQNIRKQKKLSELTKAIEKKNTNTEKLKQENEIAKNKIKNQATEIANLRLKVQNFENNEKIWKSEKELLKSQLQNQKSSDYEQE